MSGYKELLFGKIVIKNHLATQEQVDECLSIQKENLQSERYSTLGEIMVQKGYLSTEQVAKVLKAQNKTTRVQKNYLLGVLAIKNGFATKEEVLECLKIQKSQQKPEKLGEILVKRGYIFNQEHAALLKAQERLITEQFGNMDMPSLEALKKVPSSKAEVPLTKEELPPPETLSPMSNGKEEKSAKKSSSNPKSITQFIGDLAIRKGLLTLDQLQSCLREQGTLRKQGIAQTLMEIMQQKNYISQEDLEFLEQEVIVHNPRKDLIVNFEIVEKIGMGAMGVVYKAVDISGQTVALKVLLPKYSNDVKFYKRFMREGFIATTLNHPNIVKAYEVGISDEYVYFSMEYVEGETVKRIIEKNYSIPSLSAIFIVSEIAKALICAWENQLVHRDVKPDNIIITPRGEVKLCDLGIAKEIQPQTSEFTPTDKIMGTPYYVSPELVRGDGDVDIRCDIYSLGASFYHMVVGELPFEGETAPRIMIKHVLETPLPPRQRRPEIPQEVSNLIMRMMEKDLNKRIQSPLYLLNELKSLALKLKGKGD